jgi:hypothetical protein
MKLFTPLCLLSVILLCAFTPGVNTPVVKDYFEVPGPLEFNKVSYKLSWSAHPNASYYKQEYLPANENAQQFKKMIMLEVVTGDYTLQELVKTKTAELDGRKQTDPVTNYSVIQNPNTGEYVLDFVISQGTGANSIVEWNVYRYLKLKDKAGKKGVQLFAFSRRAYGTGTTEFLKQLKTDRTADINTMAGYKVPELKLAN